LIRTVKKGS